MFTRTDPEGRGPMIKTRKEGTVEATLDAISIDETVDGTRLTSRQREFAAQVGARSALSGYSGSVFLYREDGRCAARWQVSPAGHPLAVDFLY
jgi:hypothetical protein